MYNQEISGRKIILIGGGCQVFSMHSIVIQ